MVGCESLFMWQPNRKPIEVKKHSSCSEGMWITASRTGAQYLQGVVQGFKGRSLVACARVSAQACSGPRRVCPGPTRVPRTGARAAASCTVWRVARWRVRVYACVRVRARVRVQERRA